MIELDSIRDIIAFAHNREREKRMRRIAYIYPMFLVCLLAVTILYNPAYAVDFSLVAETDKSVYGVNSTVSIAGNLTLDGSPVPNGLVAVQISVPDSAIIYRALNTGTNPPGPWRVYIIDTFISNAVGNPVTNVYRGAEYLVWVRYNNSQTYPIKALITFTIFDSDSNPLYTYAPPPTYVQPGQSSPFVTAVSWIIPEDAELGAAMICANAYTDYPKNYGTPHCPEQSNSFNIMSVGGMSFSSQAGEASLQATGNFNTSFHIKQFGGRLGNYTMYTSSFMIVNLTAFIGFDTVTFQVILDGDLNHDNWVDIFDIVTIAVAFGSTPPTDPRADTNNDGTVDIFDLVYVALHYGEWGIP